MAIQQMLDSAAAQQRKEMEQLLGKTKKSMKIKKIGHCCLVIETKGVRIMTDPGMFTTAQNEEKNIDIVAITHDHPDHLHIASLKAVLVNSPDAIVVANSTVGKQLDAEGVTYQLLEDGGSAVLHELLFEGIGRIHAEIYKERGQTENTGFMIDGTLFYPGDAFTNPGRPVDILALPVSAPWLKLTDVISYALAVKPRCAFPVHDAILSHPSMMTTMIAPYLEEAGIQYVELGAGDEREF